MFALAAGKARTGRELGNPVLVTEARVTRVDALLATAVLTACQPRRGAGMVVGRPGRRLPHRLLRHAGGQGMPDALTGPPRGPRSLGPRGPL